MAWNLGNFAVGDGGEPARVAALVRDAGPDLLTLEEVSDDAALSALTAELGNEYSGVLAPSTAASPTQRVAILWRHTFGVDNITPLFESDPLFPRAVLQADVTDHLHEASRSFRVYVVHLKAGTTAQSEDLRVQEAKAIAQLIGSSPSPNNVVIGDFNEAIGDPRSGEVFAPFLEKGLFIPSLAAADAGTVTFLPAGIMLDHCAMPFDGTLSVPRFDQSVPNYQTDVSDHLPIIIDLHILTL